MGHKQYSSAGICTGEYVPFLRSEVIMGVNVRNILGSVTINFDRRAQRERRVPATFSVPDGRCKGKKWVTDQMCVVSKPGRKQGVLNSDFRLPPQSR